MEHQLETIQLLFQLIVDQLEGMEQGERPFTRVEWVGEGLEVERVGGASYKIEVKPIETKKRSSSTEEQTPQENRFDRLREGGLDVWNQQQDEEKNVITLREEQWKDLVQTCELVIQFLEYDMNKMAELSERAPDFPWKKRKEMMEGLLEGLKDGLAQTVPEEASMRF
ncbi:hypothetical protein [Marininema halotolerans]|uniref:Uncharacterized protein n=1 Tax=Marininema halotolerans TaxID=1155944 RepID=A0A1I6TL50_9BACL|nr:hypothetical protein [Marininema halotolerans]SFS89894.1 hypothetical protein SAMN05444972_11095 [Marininema halotolerans]